MAGLGEAQAPHVFGQPNNSWIVIGDLGTNSATHAVPVCVRSSSDILIWAQSSGASAQSWLHNLIPVILASESGFRPTFGVDFAPVVRQSTRGSYSEVDARVSLDTLPESQGSSGIIGSAEIFGILQAVKGLLLCVSPFVDIDPGVIGNRVPTPDFGVDALIQLLIQLAF